MTSINFFDRVEKNEGYLPDIVDDYNSDQDCVVSDSCVAGGISPTAREGSVADLSENLRHGRLVPGS
jgi:hypothetical protein